MAHTTETLDVASGEIVPISVDISAVLGVGDTVSTIATLVNEITTYEVITNAVKTSPAPAVTGTTLSLTVDATQLIPTNTYQITVFLTIAAGLKVMVVMIPLTCSDITRDT